MKIVHEDQSQAAHMFQDLTQLTTSAKQGCHSCALLLQNFKAIAEIEKVKRGKVVKHISISNPSSFTVETRIFPDHGFAAVLRQQQIVVAMVSYDVTPTAGDF